MFSTLGTMVIIFGFGSKLKKRGYVGVGPCFHLPKCHFGTVFLSHGHLVLSLRFFAAMSFLHEDTGNDRIVHLSGGVSSVLAGAGVPFVRRSRRPVGRVFV